MKKILSVLLAVCLLLALPVTAGAKGINRYTDVLQGLISQRVSGPNYGVYFDLNGDGIEELLVVRTRKNAQFASVTELTASVYTVVDGKAAVLVEDEVLYQDVGGPQGWLSIVEKDGQLYACTHGESGGTSPPMHRNGWWKVYQLDGFCKLQTVFDVAYAFYVPGMESGVDYSQSNASINGTAVSYADYEAWEALLHKKLTLDWTGKHGDSLNTLLKKAKADTTGELGSTPTKPTVGGFGDVFEGDYYADAVLWAVDNGITSGMSSTRFDPTGSCTRGQIVTFLWRANGCPSGSPVDFVDVPEGQYYTEAVKWAVENGITSGTDGSHFSPDTPCTRAQAMTFMWRAAGEPTGSGPSFGDVPAGQYYTEAVQWAVSRGITSGTSDTTFSPAQGCLRGQIVTFLYRDAVK